MDGESDVEEQTGNGVTASSTLLVRDPGNGHVRDGTYVKRLNRVSATAPLRLRDLHKRVESALAEIRFDVPAGADGLAEAARYALLAGGKRVRPVLVMATAQAAGVMPDEVLPTACAMELMHTNSLIVDDLPAMDNHARRRGRPALHKVYGDDVAVLAGCALLGEAQRLILEHQTGSAELRNIVLRVVLEATGVTGMVSGQFLDVTGYRPSSPADLARMQMLKTGSMVVACVRCGTLLAGEKTSHAFHAFAQDLGVLFQVVDDILDETGRARWLGKIPRSDRRSGKMTQVTMYGLRRAKQTATTLHEQCKQSLDEIGSSAAGSTQALREITDMVYERDW
jgi:geranylgeranyl diphosphate synthase type II